jgi:signal transduction histidine kinase
MPVVLPGESGSAGHLDVHLSIPSPAARFDALHDFVVIGVAVFVAILYVLAALVVIGVRREWVLNERTGERENRIRAMGSVAAGIAHEVRNPLNAASLLVQYLDRLCRMGKGVPAPQDYERLYAELGKIGRVIEDFVGFTRLRELNVEEFDLSDTVSGILDGLKSEAEGARVLLTRSLGGDARISGDRARLADVVRTVLQKAIDGLKAKGGGSIAVELAGGTSKVSLTISDDGRTMDEGGIHSLFDPYVTSKDGGGGFGMTLARTVVEAHGGHLDVTPATPKGLKVTMILSRRLSAIVRD